MNDYGITPEQYHAGLSKLWDALGVEGVQEFDVFTLCAARIRDLELAVRRRGEDMRRAFEAGRATDTFPSVVEPFETLRYATFEAWLRDGAE